MVCYAILLCAVFWDALLCCAILYYALFCSCCAMVCVALCCFVLCFIIKTSSYVVVSTRAVDHYVAVCHLLTCKGAVKSDKIIMSDR